MEVEVKCLQDYIVDERVLFKKGLVYVMVIDDFGNAKVFRNKDNSTEFLGSLNEMFTNEFERE